MLSTVFADADLTHPWAVQGRIPVVTSLFPDNHYEAALVVPGGEDDFFEFVEPTDEEAALVADFINFRRSYYSKGYQARMLEKPLDVDGTTNTVVFAKLEDGWVFRRGTWEAPFFSPTAVAEDKFPSLSALIDERVMTGSRLWTDWKANRTVPVLTS